MQPSTARGYSYNKTLRRLHFSFLFRSMCAGNLWDGHCQPFAQGHVHCQLFCFIVHALGQLSVASVHHNVPVCGVRDIIARAVLFAVIMESTPKIRKHVRDLLSPFCRAIKLAIRLRVAVDLRPHPPYGVVARVDISSLMPRTYRHWCDVSVPRQRPGNQ